MTCPSSLYKCEILRVFWRNFEDTTENGDVCSTMNIPGLPPAQGLYHPQHEHDACGIGFVAHIKGHKSHDLIEKGLLVLENL